MIICINLKLDNAQLNSICDKYLLSIKAILELKSSGIDRIWVEDLSIIAFTCKGDTDIKLTTTTRNEKVSRKKYKSLKSVLPIKTPKFKKEENLKKSEKLFLEFEITDIYKNKLKQQLCLN